MVDWNCWERPNREGIMDYNKIIDGVLFEGGATVSVINQELPSEGFVVSLGGQFGEIIPNRFVTNRNTFREVLVQFSVRFSSELSRENHYLGAWEENDELYLDVVEVIQDRQQAISAGQDRDQKAIWGLAQAELVETGGSGKVR